MKGLLVAVYRMADGTDRTNQGLTSRVSQAVLCDPALLWDPGLPELFESREDVPALVLMRMTIGNRVRLYCSPADPSDTGWYSFGGNFVYSDAANFHGVCEYPIPVHDRPGEARLVGPGPALC